MCFRLATAYHEAGHAVVTLALGGDVECIDMETQQMIPGQRRLLSRDEIAVFASGPTAQGIFQGATARCFSGRWWGGSGRDDHPRAAAILIEQGLNEFEAEQLLNEIVHDVFAYLSDPLVWAAISEVATECERVAILPGAKIAQIWSKHSTAGGVATKALIETLAARGNQSGNKPPSH